MSKKLTLRSVGRELRAAVEASQAKKATDIVVLDLRGLASFTDFFLLSTGSSNRQLRTIAEAIQEELEGVKVRASHVEGFPDRDWILLDYVDFVVHLFTPGSRAYYDLERLWGDAERLAIAS